MRWNNISTLIYCNRLSNTVRCWIYAPHDLARRHYICELHETDNKCSFATETFPILLLLRLENSPGEIFRFFMKWKKFSNFSSKTLSNSDWFVKFFKISFLQPEFRLQQLFHSTKSNQYSIQQQKKAYSFETSHLIHYFRLQFNVEITFN